MLESVDTRQNGTQSKQNDKWKYDKWKKDTI